MPSKEEIIEVLKTIEDPEIGMDVWTLGLVYEILVLEDHIHILMTLTTPFCPFGPEMIEEVKTKVHDAFNQDVEVKLTFHPAWQPSDELRGALGM